MRTIDITNFEGLYSVTIDGDVINKQTGLVKHPSIGSHGYHSVDLYKGGKRKTLLVHRIVADTFLDNPCKKRTVNHKDGNKLNNKLSNLEWATYSENKTHSYRELGRKAYMTGRKGELNPKSKAIVMFDLRGSFIKEFSAIMDASRELGIPNNSIVANLKGRNKRCHKYTFKYAKQTN